MTNALNFSTADCHVIGGCDVYTTKAAGGDKKLYKDIENSLESQYENLVQLSVSLSPPARTASEDGKGSEKEGSRGKRGRSVNVPDINLSRASPFGPLSQITARRTFAYLIATLNASHPDYDFSHTLRPSDFRKERSLRTIMHQIDSTLHNLRPRQQPSAYLAPPTSKYLSHSAPVNSLGGEIWNPKMWTLIDKEMGLRQCEKYTFLPDDDPFDGEEGGLWSMHSFFFNKEKKRVCYLYLRALSVISHSPVHAPAYPFRPKLVQRKASSVASVGEGAGKRASYWLGNRAGIDSESYGDDDDDEMIIEEPNDDEVEVPYMDLDDIRSDLVDGGGFYGYNVQDEDLVDDYGYWDGGWMPSGRVRGASEEVAGMMEM